MADEQQSIVSKGELERDMHSGFDVWAANHAERFRSIGTLAYHPSIFRDQRIDKPKRRVTRAIYLPETAYIRLFKKAYVRSVGSAAVANWIIEGFKITPSEALSPVSMAEYTRLNLDANQSVGVASAHADRLSDITDFTAGLSLAIADEHGKKYLDRFGVTVNKNMTRESYKVSRRLSVPLPWLASIGVNVYWGMPSDGVTKYGISQEAADYVNRQASRQILADMEKRKKKHRKEKRGIVLGVVPAGSGIIKVPEEGQPEKLIIKDASETASLFTRLGGGVIPVNRYGDEFVIGSVISTERPEGINKRGWPALLTDEVMVEHAMQVSELTGLSVEFRKLSVAGAAGRVSINS